MDESGSDIYLIGASALDREAYRLLLSTLLDRIVTVDSGFAPTGIWAAMRAKPTLAIVTTDTASAEARDAVQMVRRLRRETRVLIVSASVDLSVLSAWGACEIDGYVVKDGGVEELDRAIRGVLGGSTYFSAGVEAVIAKAREKSNGRLKLSRRETELLPLLARGMTLREAAMEMTISYKTADSYRTSLLRKLGVRDRIALVRYAIRERIVEP